MGSMGDAAAGNSVKVSLEISQASRPEDILQISEIENMKPCGENPPRCCAMKAVRSW